LKNAKLFANGEIFVKSMEELIKRYQEAIKLGISKAVYEDRNNMKCLLCNPIGTKKNRDHYHTGSNEWDDACKAMACPWIVILGKTCTAFSHEDKGMRWEAIYNTYNEDIMKTRIRQIRNWIKLYKSHMETLKKD
jgi:uncharacterized protein CbrC (UPF0167 family)